MGWETDLLEGLALHLQTAGLGTYRESGQYAPTETGIVMRAIPTGPDRIITLAIYPVDHSPGMADTTVGVQIRVRGLRQQPNDCNDLASDIYDALDSLGRATWNGVAIVDCYRQSHTSLGADGQDRWSRSENYYVDAMRPTVLNTD